MDQSKTKKRNTASLSIFESDMITASDVGDFMAVDAPVEFRKQRAAPRAITAGPPNLPQGVFIPNSNQVLLRVAELLVHSWETEEQQCELIERIKGLADISVVSPIVDSTALMSGTTMFDCALDFLGCPPESDDFDRMNYYLDFMHEMGDLEPKDHLGFAKTFVERLLNSRFADGWDAPGKNDTEKHIGPDANA
jgi:hypothetical protein